MTLFDLDRPVAVLRDCPVHVRTPLHRHRTKDRDVWLKDESARMGLGSFKALGGVYAVARLLQARLGRMPSPGDRHDVTFTCASAGNHGLSVAAGARLFGARARVHLAETVDEAFADRLRAKGARVVRSGATYDQSVTAAVADAKATGAIHLADGSWPGYTEPPRLVMEGYTVMGEELRQQFTDARTWPAHVYLQAGVGGLAAALAYVIRNRWPVQPEIVVVEPDAAPCLAASHAAGHPVTVSGPESIMGRLDCKAPSLLALEVLTQTVDRFVTVSDSAAEMAMNTASDLGHASTPSGCAGLAAMLRDNAGPALVILSEGTVCA
ncbi:pyridoxal-phosphate dependent enzyme [Jannaschia sp. M317]|uniref:pyridoxal-phosphate dependent enzyme n=1 Tax=Jannaschia sp. M317 TaxID=2867011 RepID=UPI0021A8EA88|nr:pyridoxal-phosphate dependent enzyme [Jannaschia sp. M317]UWQ17666.1 pyridoxal-phosphate dependent enzyme [Jannaschia sp. M317]